jgi:hypothetical protein
MAYFIRPRGHDCAVIAPLGHGIDIREAHVDVPRATVAWTPSLASRHGPKFARPDDLARGPGLRG